MEITRREYDPDRISVVIPAYNSAATLEEAVDSVMRQTYENVEAIVIDDGSTDDTSAVIARIGEKYPNLITKRKDNAGVSAARNDGIAMASGGWLVTLDADDWLEPEMLGRMHYLARNNDLDLCICGFTEVTENGTPIRSFRPDMEYIDYKDEFTETMFLSLFEKRLISTHSNKLYRTELILKKGIWFDPELSINEDIDFCLRYMGRCRSIGAVRGAYLNYRQHAVGQSQITTFRANGLAGALKVLHSYNEYFDAADLGDGLVNAMNNRMLEHICSFAGLMYYRSDYSDGKILSELKWLCENEEFQLLLRQTRPEGLKNLAAAMLLRHKQTGLYHRLCRLLYRGQKKINTRA